MYELVNTSLPNGLIAGTHGYATVAMTRGLPDILRGRLEALCAYAHRSSSHNVEYYEQNPVNWFHVVLPQGEHVVGRVAPCDFDYTGRTNRLARLRVFGASEMPEIGGAEILSKEVHWFKESWQGEPRYLAEDRKTSGLLRMLEPVRGLSAPSWEVVFGSSGTNLARKVAKLLENNIGRGGKAIYFKTSPEWDVTGERLLGLFKDVINFLPVEMRGKATFSTYPVSLPGGTGCHLRGVYDRDRAFDAASASQVWIDCENARVVHAELLPESVQASVPHYESVPVADVPSEPPRKIVIQSQPSVEKRDCDRVVMTPVAPGSYRDLIARTQPKKGLDMFVVTLIVGGLAMLVVAFFLFHGMISGAKDKINTIKGEITKDDSKVGSSDQKDALDREEMARQKAAEEERKRKEKEAAKKRAAEEKKKEAEKRTINEKKKEEIKERAAIENERQEEAKKNEQKRLRTAFLEAEHILRGSPAMDVRNKGAFNSGNGCLVYYYADNMKLTNAPAHLEKTMYGSEILKWGPDLKRSDSMLKGFVVWYNPKIKRAYIDVRNVVASGSKSQWFARGVDKVNLAKEFFGSESAFAQLWGKYLNQKKAKIIYKIKWSFLRSNGEFLTEKGTLSKQEVLAEIKKDFAQKLEKEIKDFKDQIMGYKKEIKDASEELAKIYNAHNYGNLKRRINDWENLDEEIKKKKDEKNKSIGDVYKRSNLESSITKCRDNQAKILAGNEELDEKKFDTITELRQAIARIENMTVVRELNRKKEAYDKKIKEVESRLKPKKAYMKKVEKDIADKMSQVYFLVDVHDEQSQN